MKRTYQSGLWDSPNNQAIPETALSVATDVEYDGISIKKRTDPDSFDFPSGYTPEQFYVWYPSTMPETATGDYIIVFLDNLSLYIAYQVGSSWNTAVISIDDVTYTSLSVLNFAPLKDSLIIVDGVNRPHFIRIDKEQEISYGLRGYPAPTTKLEIEEMPIYDGKKFQEINTEPYFSELGVLEVTYAYKDIFGNYSNPAPISKFNGDYQFFKLIAEGEDNAGGDDRFLRKLVFSKAQIPTALSSGLYDNIEDFVFYCRVRRYSSDSEAGYFRECLTAKILSKDPDTTINNYSVSSLMSDTSPSPDYNNNVPPIAKLVESVDSTTFYGDVSDNLPFPFNFQYYQKIEISNPNSNTVTGAKVRIRLRENDIENFIVSDFYSGGVLAESEHLRFYDTDLTTPLQTTVYGYALGGHIDVIAYIPQLIGSSVDEIYFCFNPTAYQDSSHGVSDKYNTANNFGFLHGRFCVPSSQWQYQQVFNYPTCKNENNIICSPMNEKDWVGNDEVINRHDINNNGTLSNASWLGSSSAFIPLMGSVADGYGVNSIQLDADTGRIRFGEEIFADNEDEIDTTYGFIKFNKSDLKAYETGAIRYFNAICSNAGKADGVNELRGWVLALKYAGDSITPCLLYQTTDQDMFRVLEFAQIGVKYITTLNFFFSVGVDFENGKTKVFIYDKSEGIVSNSNEQTIPHYDDYDPSSNQDVNFGYLGSAINVSFDLFNYVIYGIDNAIYSQGDFIKNTYINNYDIINGIMNFLPYYDTAYIGWNGTSDNYISFGNVKDNSVKNESSKLLWTPQNGINVPATNEKYLTESIRGIIEAKSFLKQNYETSLLITSRNELTRFVADDDGFSFNRNLIKEFTQYGQLSNNIVSMGESWYWGSETGAMQWSPNGIRIISNGMLNGLEIKRINLQITSTTKVIPIPVNRQVLFWNGSSGYLYDENGDRWTYITNLDINGFDVLTRGNQVDNKTMFLTSSGTFQTYPGTNYTSQSPNVITKHYQLDNMKLRKIKANFDSHINIRTTITNDTGSKQSELTDIINMRWYGMPSGSWGYKYYHQFTNLIKIHFMEEMFLKRG